MSDLLADPRYHEGIALFNQRQFYACHDIFEALWHEAIEPDRTFLQGILQIAVGLHHLSNLNRRGATILLGEGGARLQDYQPDYAAVDVSDLLAHSEPILQSLQALTDGDSGEAIAIGLGLHPGNAPNLSCPRLRLQTSGV
ncbi:DUF309 domain-containing protein [Synechococcus elongatus IITB4]|uniref:DUF309 domain-containing protein n=1 Tax=Synechococcus elongatus TaxID=32046 RepID=UPI0030D59F2B